MAKPPYSPVAPPRHSVPLFISLGDTPIGRTRNLSATGVFLETGERPAVDSRHDLSIVWGDETFTCAVRVVRHADDGVGLVFEDPDTFFRQALDEILADTTQPASPVSLADPA